MKILLDANISWKLISALKPIFGECRHVDLIGLSVPATDTEIWNYALIHKYIIITKDNDFLDLLELKGFPPRLVLIKIGNNSSQALLNLLVNAKPQIDDMQTSDYGLLEIYAPGK